MNRVAFLLVLVTAACRAADVPDMSLATPDACARWTFRNGAEFPGATGSFEHHDGGGVLGFDFAKGGRYVAIERTFDPPVDAESLAMRVRLPAMVSLEIQAMSPDGKTSIHRIYRPVGSMDPQSWLPLGVDLRSSDRPGPIQRLSLVAGLRWVPDPSVTGAAIAIRDLAFAPIGGVLGGSTSTLPVPAVHPLTELIGICANVADTRELDAVRGLGLTHVRMDVHWSWVETAKDVWSFAKLDGWLQAVADRGLQPLLICNYGHPDYTGSETTPPTTPEARQGFAAFAAAVVKRYAGRGYAYELWNEPNYERFWQAAPGSPDPATAYAELVRVAAPAMRSADPHAVISLAGTSLFHFPYTGAIVASGAADAVDFVAVHPYLAWPESLGEQLLVMRRLIDDATSRRQRVWCTEWGYSSTAYGDGLTEPARVRQAQFLVRSLLCCWASGLERTYIYNLRDVDVNGADGECNFGLIDAAFAPKPAHTALRTLLRAAHGRTLAGALALGPAQVQALRLAGGASDLVVAWNDGSGGDVPVRLPATAQVWDVFGRPVDAPQDGDGRTLILREADGPRWIRPQPARGESAELVAP